MTRPENVSSWLFSPHAVCGVSIPVIVWPEVLLSATIAFIYKSDGVVTLNAAWQCDVGYVQTENLSLSVCCCGDENASSCNCKSLALNGTFKYRRKRELCLFSDSERIICEFSDKYNFSTTFVYLFVSSSNKAKFKYCFYNFGTNIIVRECAVSLETFDFKWGLSVIFAEICSVEQKTAVFKNLLYIFSHTIPKNLDSQPKIAQFFYFSINVDNL